MTPSGKPKRSVEQGWLNFYLQHKATTVQTPASQSIQGLKHLKIRITAAHPGRSDVVQCKLGEYIFYILLLLEFKNIPEWDYSEYLKNIDDFGSLHCRYIQRIHFLHYQAHLIYCLLNWPSAKSLFKKKKKKCSFPGCRCSSSHSIDIVIWFLWQKWASSRSCRGERTTLDIIWNISQSVFHQQNINRCYKKGFQGQINLGNTGLNKGGKSSLL